MKRSVSPPRSKVKPVVEPGEFGLFQHLSTLVFSLGQLARTPVSSLLIIAVISIALVLPSGLYLFLENVRQVSHGWSEAVQISLFLRTKITDEQAKTLAEQLRQRQDIQSVQVITKEEALREYRALSGFGNALDLLEENPLPTVLVVQPVTDNVTSQTVQTLLDDLSQLPSVEIVQSDTQWLKRLFALIEIIRRGVWILSTLLALAVVLIVGNTIRLAIYGRREEIEVNKLFGATDAFIRRPFLYTGFWYGLIGGSGAWALVNSAFWLLKEPVKQLALLYQSPFELVTLNIGAGLILLMGGIFLGLGGAWLAVGRHLREIQPR